MDAIQNWWKIAAPTGVFLISIYVRLYSALRGRTSLLRKFARWSSAAGALVLCQEARTFEQEERIAAQSQRDIIRRDRDWLQSEVDIKDREIQRLRALNVTPPPSPATASSDASSDGSTSRAGARPRRKPGNDS
jgi:hypothetical protein